MLDALVYTRPPCDGTEDISDAWQDETDPLNERGEVCEAHFVDSVTGYVCRCALVAISLTFGDGADPRTSTLPRELAEALLGVETVTRLERNRADRLDEE